MVTMKFFIAVFCLVVAALAEDEEQLSDEIKQLLETRGKQYELYKTFTNEIAFTGDPLDDLFKGLNIDQNEDITKDDLEVFFWYKDVKYAVAKTLKITEDEGKIDKKLEKDELKNELDDKKFKVALVECTYLKSPGLRQSCLADQLLTYTALCLDKDDVDSFFDHLNTDKKTEGLTEEELKVIKYKEETDTFIIGEELGLHTGDEKLVTKAEFTEYVTQESVNDDFRVCRKKEVDVKTGNIDFDNECLTKELAEYIYDDLTEMDIAVLYRIVNKEKGKITKDDLKDFTEIKDDDDKLQKMMDMLDMSLTSKTGTQEVDFAEFRSYLRSPTVLIQLERDCVVKEKTQVKEITCLKKKLKDLFKDIHKPIWLVVPDLEQWTAFEILDDNAESGVIKNDDLSKFSSTKFQVAQTKTRFFAEVDVDDNGEEDVDLEEFNEYIDVPHMVYGTADCLLTSRKTEIEKREACYPREIADIIDNFKNIEKEAFQNWFNHYDDKDGKDNGKIEASDKLKGMLGDLDQDLFLKELGQGGVSIEEFEFIWYVKQQELADRYDDKLGATTKYEKFDGDKIQIVHGILITWVKDDVTEYDVERFFDELDTNNDHELKKEEFVESERSKIDELLKKIDATEKEGDADQNVNFREFWLWLNSPKSGKNKDDTLTLEEKVKYIFKQSCTEPKETQQEEIDCMVEAFKDTSKFESESNSK